MEDFHTKALRLVTQAGYEGAAKDRVLRDNIISGLASEKIRAKIVKEGHEVTLNQVMEIARLEVSMQHHLERMAETAKVNYVQYGKSSKSKSNKKKPQSSAGATGQGACGHKTGAGGHRGSRPSGKFNKRPPLPPDTCYRCGKGKHQKYRTARLWMLLAEGVAGKDIMRRFACKGNALHSLETQANSAGAGASEPLYFNDEGQPVYTYMVSVPHANVNKHLIKFPVALDPTTLKGNNADSPQSTVLLKADTGADVNLMNRKTFHQLFGDSQVLKPTPIKMEN